MTDQGFLLQVVVDGDGIGDQGIVLSVLHESGLRWKSRRSIEECQLFVENFKHLLADSTGHDAAGLQSSINAILRNPDSNVWSSAVVLKFLDTDQSQSPFTTLKLQLMERKVDQLVQLVKNYETRLGDIEEKNSRLTSLLTLHLTNLDKKHASTFASSSASQVDQKAAGIAPVDESSKKAFVAPVQVNNQGLEDDEEGSISDLSTPSNKVPANPASTSDAPPLAAFFQEDVPASSNVAWGSLEEAPEAGTLQDVQLTAHMQEMLNHLSLCSAESDLAVDAVVKLVQPHESQIMFRESAMTFLKRQVKFALNALCFETAFVELRCFLPGDPLCLTLVVPQNQLTFWQSSLMDRLKLIIDAMVEGRYRPSDDGMEEGGRSSIKHTLRSLSAMSDQSGNKVVCAIDAIEVQMSVNNRLDLCMNSFLEEFDAKVGKKHLFKRSLLLLRAWWTYESLAYAGPGVAQVKHYLPDQVLAIMLVMVFNQYSRDIKSPLQALVLFFAEFAKYNPDVSVITLQGVVPFSGTSAYPALEPVQRHHLVDADMAEKFWLLFNVEAQPMEQMGAARPTDPSARHRSLFESMSRALEKFERNSFNVLHPFTHANLMQEKVSSRRVEILRQIFQAAAQNLTVALKTAYDNAAYASDIMGKFFPSVMGRFTNDFRPDAVNQSLSNSSPVPMDDILKTNVEALWEAVHFANFIIEYVIMDSAVITFCTDLLMTKGPLPAGEVGKVLSETSCVPQLSHRLREKYGGLKKLLEKYSDIFVFSNDHPFNPHVLLRKTLSVENLELVDRGIFPVHLLTKYPKTPSATRKSSKSISSGASGSSTGNSLSPSPYMKEQSQISASAIDRAHAILSNNYPPYGDNPHYPPSASIQPFTNSSAYGGGTSPPPHPYAPPGGASGYSPTFNPRAAAQNRLNSSYPNRGMQATPNIPYGRPSGQQHPSYDQGYYNNSPYPSAPRGGRGVGQSLDSNAAPYNPAYGAPEQSYDNFSARAAYPPAARDKPANTASEGSLSVLASLRQGNSASARGYESEVSNQYVGNTGGGQGNWHQYQNSNYQPDSSTSSFPSLFPNSESFPRPSNAAATESNRPYVSKHGGSEAESIGDFRFSSSMHNN